MSGSRGFFYDDCRSADRLAREYTRIVGADNLLVEYQADIGKFAYTVTRTGSALCTWLIKSTQSSNSFQATFLFKKFNAAPNTAWGSFGVAWDGIDVNNISQCLKTDVLYFERYVGGVRYYKFWASGLTNDIWYNYKLRRNGKDVRIKIWQYGTSEPDWQHTNYEAPGGSNENPLKYSFRPGNFGIVTYWPTVGDWSKIADIRITPIRKVGGP